MEELKYTILGIGVFFAVMYVTRPTPADVERCQVQTGWTSERCALELSR